MSDEQTIIRIYGLKVGATPNALHVVACDGDVATVADEAIPWPDVLEAAPTEAIVEALRGREGVYHFDRCLKGTLEFPTLHDILAVPVSEVPP